ncbi:MAG: HAD-IA family hydrolase [Candidatus Solibacter usitatus]|nr:HAD-IA family hydrolase [Candidatus Solibacter usitatus]
MNLLIFDLDGTLIDSQLDLANAVNAARGHMNLPPLENSAVYAMVGHGAPVLIRRALGPDAPDADVERALEFFLKHYREHMLDHTVLYEGVRETLDSFRARGLPMAILTNKPVNFSVSIIAGLGLTDHFFRIYGGNSFDFKKPHPVGVNALLEESGVGREKACMVGDSAVDIRTARNAGIRSYGVTYGFQPESLAAEPPDVLLDNFSGLMPFVLG